MHVVSSIVITTMMIYFYEPECFFISRGNAATCHCRTITAANISVRRKKKQKINPQDKSAYGIAPGRYKPKLFVYLESKSSEIITNCVIKM